MSTSGNTSASTGTNHSLSLTLDTIDRLSVYSALVTGVPGNILTILTLLSLPSTAAGTHVLALTSLDFMSMLFRCTLRLLAWSGEVDVTSSSISLSWKFLFNMAYYAGVCANSILVLFCGERLVCVRFSNQYVIYFSAFRTKVTLILNAILIFSFGVIVTFKMTYFGIAWVVVYMAFYGVGPLFLIVVCFSMVLATICSTSSAINKYLDSLGKSPSKSGGMCKSGSTLSGIHKMEARSPSRASGVSKMSKSPSKSSGAGGGAGYVSKSPSKQSGALKTNKDEPAFGSSVSLNKDGHRVTTIKPIKLALDSASESKDSEDNKSAASVKFELGKKGEATDEGRDTDSGQSANEETPMRGKKRRHSSGGRARPVSAGSITTLNASGVTTLRPPNHPLSASQMTLTTGETLEELSVVRLKELAELDDAFTRIMLTASGLFIAVIIPSIVADVFLFRTNRENLISVPLPIVTFLYFTHGLCLLMHSIKFYLYLIVSRKFRYYFGLFLTCRASFRNKRSYEVEYDMTKSFF